MKDNYNIEDTARLMTMSSRKMNKKTIILIVAAIIAVAVVAVVGLKMAADKKYDKQVALAEKSLREGNYEQAETAYLAAVDMNGRKPKAREGLAYTYALESKFDESKKIYDELFAETKEEKYEEASISVEKQEIPVIKGISPEDLWINLGPDRLPDGDGAEAFLTDYMSRYSLFSSLDKSGDRIEDYRYDCEDSGDSYVMSFAYAYLPEEDTQWIMDENDPKGWSQGYYRTTDKAKIDGVMADVFHADSDKLEEAVAKLEERGVMYAEGGRYYQANSPLDGPVIYAEISDAWICDGRFCIEYDATVEVNGPDLISGDPHIGTFYAVMDITGKEAANGWAMYYNGIEMPDYVAEAIASAEDSGEDESGKGSGKDGEKSSDDLVFGQLSGYMFYFSIGAGGWETDLTINPDGTFEGYYSDSDMGETGDDYPNGTRHECTFSGKFTSPEKVDEYTYRFTVEDLICAEEPGKESIEDGIRVIQAEPYGAAMGDAVELYLPGKSASDLPAAFTDWVQKAASEDDYIPEAKVPGMMIGECVFRGYKE